MLNIAYLVAVAGILLVLVNGAYRLPKIVWTHWNTTDLPELCRLNLERTRRILHDWDVRFFTDADFFEWCDEIPTGFDALSKAHKADFMRLWLLREHGGVWMDISIVLNTSITPIYDECRSSRAELSGFYINGSTTDPRYPVFENWFIMAPKGSRIIALWYEEFCKAIRIGFAEYKKEARAANLHFHNLLNDGEDDVYLTQHLCYQKVIQHRVWRQPVVLYRKAEDTMFSIHIKCEWKIDCMKAAFRSPQVHSVPFIKLRGGDRALFPVAFFD